MLVLRMQVPLQPPPAAPFVEDRFKDTPGGLVNRAGIVIRIARIASLDLDFWNAVTQLVPELLAVRESILVRIHLGKGLVPFHLVIEEIDAENIEIAAAQRRASVGVGVRLERAVHGRLAIAVRGESRPRVARRSEPGDRSPPQAPRRARHPDDPSRRGRPDRWSGRADVHETGAVR